MLENRVHCALMFHLKYVLIYNITNGRRKLVYSPAQAHSIPFQCFTGTTNSSLVASITVLSIAHVQLYEPYRAYKDK